MFDNIAPERPTWVTHLECSRTGETYPADQLAGLSRAGAPLLVRYDLQGLGAALGKDDLRDRPQDMWRYREFLPVRSSENIVSLGETMTPILSAPRTAGRIGAAELLVKDEGRLPTGSFKARGLSVAVSMAKALGVERIAIPSAGNAGVALAAYCARAGIEAYVFYADDPPHNPAPDITVCEIPLFGAHSYSVNGVITQIGPIIEQAKANMGWFSMATLKEPYRVEGKKTMGLELAEQFGWELPEVIFYPTGGGTGIIAMWKAFEELEAIGWIGSKRPRFIAVQAETCAPIVRAFHAGTETAEPWVDGHTGIAGMRVPFTVGDALILRALRESGGGAIAINEADVPAARAEIAAADGIHLCSEGAALLVACKQALAEGLVGSDERVVLFNTAAGLKAPPDFRKERLDINQPNPFLSA